MITPYIFVMSLLLSQHDLLDGEVHGVSFRQVQVILPPGAQLRQTKTQHLGFSLRSRPNEHLKMRTLRT